MDKQEYFETKLAGFTETNHINESMIFKDFEYKLEIDNKLCVIDLTFSYNSNVKMVCVSYNK